MNERCYAILSEEGASHKVTVFLKQGTRASFRKLFKTAGRKIAVHMRYRAMVRQKA